MKTLLGVSTTVLIMTCALPATALTITPKTNTMTFTLPNKNQLIEAYYSMNTLPKLPTLPPKKPAFDMYQENIAALAKEGKLSLQMAMTVMDLRNQTVTPTELQTILSKLKITPALSKQITKWYF